MKQLILSASVVAIAALASAQDVEFTELVFSGDAGVKPVEYYDGTFTAAGKKTMEKAREDILTNRRGDFTLNLKGPDGKPITGDVEVEQIKTDFEWGVNLQSGIGVKFHGGRNRGFAGKTYVAADTVFTVARDGTFFRNMLGKESKRPTDEFEFDSVDGHPETVGWARDRDMMLRWHVLFYHHGEGRMPDWTDQVKSEEEWWPILDRYLATLAKRNDGWFEDYDVINEVFTCAGSYKKLNSTHPRLFEVESAKRLFEMARKHFPTEKLVALEWWALGKDAETHGGPQHWKPILKFYKELVASGAPVDRLGTQCHFGINDWQQLLMENLSRHLDMLGEIGKPVVITEYSDPSKHRLTPPEFSRLDENELADWSSNFFTLVYSKPYTRQLVRWQMLDGTGGAALDGGLITLDGRLKPQFHALNRLINEEWKTSVTGKSEQGTVKFTGYEGTYEIRVPGYTPETVQLTKQRAQHAITLKARILDAKRPSRSAFEAIPAVQFDRGQEVGKLSTYRNSTLPENGAVNMQDGDYLEYTVTADAGIYDLTVKAASKGDGLLTFTLKGKTVARVSLKDGGLKAFSTEWAQLPEAKDLPLRMTLSGAPATIESIRFSAPVIRVYNDKTEVQADSYKPSAETGTVFSKSSARQTYRIANSGNVPLKLQAPTVEGEGKGAFAVEADSLIVNPGKEAKLTVTYAPESGKAAARIKLPCNDRTRHPFFFAIKGE